MESWTLENFSSNKQHEPRATAMHVAKLEFDLSTNWLCVLFYLDTKPLHPYEPVGCFQDKRDPRALPIIVQRYSVDETDLANSLGAIIHACATKVYEMGFLYFGVEYRHECWSSVNDDVKYYRHGPSDNCLWNYSVGAEWSIFVYRFVEGYLLVDNFTEI